MRIVFFCGGRLPGIKLALTNGEAAFDLDGCSSGRKTVLVADSSGKALPGVVVISCYLFASGLVSGWCITKPFLEITTASSVNQIGIVVLRKVKKSCLVNACR